MKINWVKEKTDLKLLLTKTPARPPVAGSQFTDVYVRIYVTKKKECLPW